MAEGQIYKIHSDFYYVDDGVKSHECKIREVLKKQRENILSIFFPVIPRQLKGPEIISQKMSLIPENPFYSFSELAAQSLPVFLIGGGKKNFHRLRVCRIYKIPIIFKVLQLLRRCRKNPPAALRRLPGKLLLRIIRKITFSIQLLKF